MGSVGSESGYKVYESDGDEGCYGDYGYYVEGAGDDAVVHGDVGISC